MIKDKITGVLNSATWTQTHLHGGFEPTPITTLLLIFLNVWQSMSGNGNEPYVSREFDKNICERVFRIVLSHAHELLQLEIVNSACRKPLMSEGNGFSWSERDPW